MKQQISILEIVYYFVFCTLDKLDSLFYYFYLATMLPLWQIKAMRNHLLKTFGSKEKWLSFGRAQSKWISLHNTSSFTFLCLFCYIAGAPAIIETFFKLNWTFKYWYLYAPYCILFQTQDGPS